MPSKRGDDKPDAKTPAKKATKPAAGDPAPEIDTRERLDVVVKGAFNRGELTFAAGQKVAEVTLEPGVSLNFVVDGVRTGILTDN